jgi:hypothetical protein
MVDNGARVGNSYCEVHFREEYFWEVYLYPPCRVEILCDSDLLLSIVNRKS